MDVLLPPARVRSHSVPTIVAVVLGCLVVAAAAAFGIVILLQQQRPPVAPNTYTMHSVPPQHMMQNSQGQEQSQVRLQPGDVNCSVTYTQTTPCEGDCWEAYAFYEGTVVVPPAGNGAPCPPLFISISCADTMPCACRGSDLPLPPAASLTTCSDCDYVLPGASCYLSCADPSLEMMGTGQMTCANGTWAYAGLPPTCNPVLATCPTIMNINTDPCHNNGILVQPGSTCVGAIEGDVCNISCSPGFAVPPGSAHVARCHNGAWTDVGTGAATQLQCAAQASCVAGANTCAGPPCTPTPTVGFGRVGPLLPSH